MSWLDLRHSALLLGLAMFATIPASDAAEITAATPGQVRFERVAGHGSTQVYLWRDVSNVYVLRDGDAAMMIDIGDGSVLDHLAEIGVRRLEWVLLTHHHREQCQGHPKLRACRAQVGAPEKERALLERPADFRKIRPSLGDPFTVHGASYVRPPVDPLPVDRGFKTMDTFTWHGHEFWCLETAGNSPGSMSYLLKTGQGWLAFTGDVMLAGARMHNWFDTEWDYGKDVGPIQFDRLFKPGEKLRWEGYELTVDWMPGQTEFGCAIQGIIDGRRVAFTGDNLFADPQDPKQDGHEAVCARNSAILEEGYIYGADYLRRLRPDLLIGGHSFVMDRPRDLIERYHQWSLAIREDFRELSAEGDYHLMFDPYWVRVDPYRTKLDRGDGAKLTLLVRNFLPRTQAYGVALHLPEGISAEPAVVEGAAPAEATVRIPIRLKVHAGKKPGISLVGLDTTLDGKRYGQWFDFIVEVPKP